MRHALSPLCLLALAAGCAMHGAPSKSTTVADSPVPAYSGHYEFGFELAAFTPCNVPETWWVAAGGPTALQPLTDFVTRNYAEFHHGMFRGGRLYVRWRGTLSRPGRYGHFGSYRRRLDVLEVLEVRWPTPRDCGYPADDLLGFKVGDKVRPKRPWPGVDWGIVDQLIPEQQLLLVNMRLHGRRMPVKVKPSEVEHVR